MRYLAHAIFVFVFLALPAHLGAQHLQCQPCTRGFGQVLIGSSKTAYVLLTNTGSKSLRIRSKTKAAVVFYFGNFPLPVTLAPGASVKLPLIFTPTAPGSTTGNATLVSNALNPQLEINLIGRGIDNKSAQLAITPSILNFGNVAVGSSATQQATLTASRGPVTVGSAGMTNPEYSLPGLVLPLNLAPGQSLPVTVRFTPGASGMARGRFVVRSDAGTSPDWEPLRGTGVAGGSHRADLSWDPGNGVIGYNVYRGGAHGGPYAQINTALDSSTNYVDTSVAGGATYFYVATSVDANGQESRYSKEAKVMIPGP